MKGKDKETFRPIDTYYMKINDMSPSFSLGYVFNSNKEFVDFIKRYGKNTYNEDNNKVTINLSMNFDNIFTIKLLSKTIDFKIIQKIEPFITYIKK